MRSTSAASTHEACSGDTRTTMYYSWPSVASLYVSMPGTARAYRLYVPVVTCSRFFKMAAMVFKLRASARTDGVTSCICRNAVDAVLAACSGRSPVQVNDQTSVNLHRRRDRSRSTCSARGICSSVEQVQSIVIIVVVSVLRTELPTCWSRSDSALCLTWTTLWWTIQTILSQLF